MNERQKQYLKEHSAIFGVSEETYLKDMRCNYVVIENGNYNKPLHFRGNAHPVIYASLSDAYDIVSASDVIVTEEEYFNHL